MLPFWIVYRVLVFLPVILRIFSNGSLHLAVVLRSLARCSWLSSGFLPGVICPSSGSMAGTSIADLLFLVAFSSLLSKFDSRCASCGMSTPLVADKAADFYGLEMCPTSVDIYSIGYMDDVCRPVFCSARDILSKVRNLTRIMFETFY